MKKKRCGEDKNIIVDNSHIPTHGVAIFANSKIVCSTAVAAAACTGVTSVAAMAAAIKRNYMTDMDVIDDTNSTHSTKKKK